MSAYSEPYPGYFYHIAASSGSKIHLFERKHFNRVIILVNLYEKCISYFFQSHVTLRYVTTRQSDERLTIHSLSNLTQ
jgi:hypothetical protein